LDVTALGTELLGQSFVEAGRVVTGPRISHKPRLEMVTCLLQRDMLIEHHNHKSRFSHTTNGRSDRVRERSCSQSMPQRNAHNLLMADRSSGRTDEEA
jgi:hypothetical protein